MQSSQMRILSIIALVLLAGMAAVLPAIADAPSGAQVTLVSGTITALSATAISVQLPDNGKLVTDTLGSSLAVLIDGMPKSLADLKVGLAANVVTSGGVVTEIDARTPNTDAWGKITSVSAAAVTVATSGGDTDTYAIDSTTRISLYSKIVTAADLKADMYAHVTYTSDAPGTASSIEVVRPDNGTTRGKISAIDAKSITLQSRKGDLTTFTIDAKTTVTINDKPGKFADVHAGQYAQITTPDGTIAAAITVVEPPLFGDRRGPGPDGDGQ